MLGIFTFIFSAGGGKLFPLLFGNYVARRFGHFEYGSLVQALAQANVLTSVSTVSYVQLILSSRGRSGHYALQAFLFSAGVAIAGGLLAARESLAIGAFVAAYAFGNSVLTVAVGQLNAELKNGRAGTFLFVGWLLPYLAGLVAVLAGNTYPVVLVSIALMFSLVSTVAYLGVNRANLANLGAKELPSLLSGSIPLKWEHLSLMIFVGSILFSHSRVLTHVNSARGHGEEPIAAFMLAYQLFAIGLFIPSTLGNVVTPRLSRAKSSEKRLGLLGLVYAAIAVGWLGAVWIAHGLILKLYKLPVSSYNVGTILVLQAAVIPASVGALLNQHLAAERRLTTMAGLWVVFAALLSAWSWSFDYEPFASAAGFGATYVVTLILYATVFSRLERRMSPRIR